MRYGWGERRRHVRLAAGLLLIAAGPLLLFGALRWSLVGHFGLTSFGGYDLAGVTAPLITEDNIDRLPRADRPLAQRILERRGELGRIPVPERSPGTTGELMEAWAAEYEEAIWEVSATAAASLAGGRDPTHRRVDVNRRLSSLATSMVRIEAKHYLRWVRFQLVRGFRFPFWDVRTAANIVGKCLDR